MKACASKVGGGSRTLRSWATARGATWGHSVASPRQRLPMHATLAPPLPRLPPPPSKLPRPRQPPPPPPPPWIIAPLPSPPLPPSRERAWRRCAPAFIVPPTLSHGCQRRSGRCVSQAKASLAKPNAPRRARVGGRPRRSRSVMRLVVQPLAPLPPLPPSIAPQHEPSPPSRPSPPPPPPQPLPLPLLPLHRCTTPLRTRSFGGRLRALPLSLSHNHRCQRLPLPHALASARAIKRVCPSGHRPSESGRPSGSVDRLRAEQNVSASTLQVTSGRMDRCTARMVTSRALKHSMWLRC